LPDTNFASFVFVMNSRSATIPSGVWPERVLTTVLGLKMHAFFFHAHGTTL